jgi:hypothetical protein
MSPYASYYVYVPVSDVSTPPPLRSVSSGRPHRLAEAKKLDEHYEEDKIEGEEGGRDEEEGEEREEER